MSHPSTNLRYERLTEISTNQLLTLAATLHNLRYRNRDQNITYNDMVVEITRRQKKSPL